MALNPWDVFIESGDDYMFGAVDVMFADHSQNTLRGAHPRHWVNWIPLVSITRTLLPRPHQTCLQSQHTTLTRKDFVLQRDLVKKDVKRYQESFQNLHNRSQFNVQNFEVSSNLKLLKPPESFKQTKHYCIAFLI